MTPKPWSPEELEAALVRLEETGCLDSSGRVVSDGNLRDIVARAPLDERGRPSFSEVSFRDARIGAVGKKGRNGFSGAVFERPADFRGVDYCSIGRFKGVVFRQPALFLGARFGRAASFAATSFEEAASFRHVTFRGAVEFNGARFHEVCSFKHSTFGGVTRFDVACWEEEARFEDAEFFQEARWDHAIFRGAARFERAVWKGQAHFPGTVFDGALELKAARAEDDLLFRAARFDGVTRIGPLRVSRDLVLDRSVFRLPVVVDAETTRASLNGTRFEHRASIHVRYADVVLDGSRYGEPSTLGGGSASPAQPAGPLPATFRDQARPRLLSLEGTDTNNLVLVDVDLAVCRFDGAHALSALRMEGQSSFAPVPEGWFPSGFWPVRWSPRRTIAEEHLLRSQDSGSGWGDCLTPAPSSDTNAPEPDRVAAVYRSLRKGLEDAKDEPGAADFYYGEMEMRRIGAKVHGRWAEWALLTAYWLISGYALRASRALVFLLLTVGLFGAAIAAVGYPECRQSQLHDLVFGATGCHHTFADALLQSARSTTSLLRAPDAELNTRGQLLELVLRLLGPLFFGLTLFSLRARLKR